jgi:hypothetical protein
VTIGFSRMTLLYGVSSEYSTVAGFGYDNNKPLGCMRKENKFYVLKKDHVPCLLVS